MRCKHGHNGTGMGCVPCAVEFLDAERRNSYCPHGISYSTPCPLCVAAFEGRTLDREYFFSRTGAEGFKETFEFTHDDRRRRTGGGYGDQTRMRQLPDGELQVLKPFTFGRQEPSSCGWCAKRYPEASLTAIYGGLIHHLNHLPAIKPATPKPSFAERYGVTVTPGETLLPKVVRDHIADHPYEDAAAANGMALVPYVTPK